MKKFGAFEIDVEKIIAVRWVYAEGLAPKDGFYQKIKEGKPSSVRIYTDNHQFVLEGEDFEAYRDAQEE